MLASYSPQYSKAWRASFPPNLWPADERWQFQPERRITLILQDGTELSSGGSADEWQPESVARAGYHRTYIGQLERGEKSPSLRTLFSLSATPEG